MRICLGSAWTQRHHPHHPSPAPLVPPPALHIRSKPVPADTLLVTTHALVRLGDQREKRNYGMRLGLTFLEVRPPALRICPTPAPADILLVTTHALLRLGEQ